MFLKVVRKIGLFLRKSCWHFDLFLLEGDFDLPP